MQLIFQSNTFSKRMIFSLAILAIVIILSFHVFRSAHVQILNISSRNNIQLLPQHGNNLGYHVPIEKSLKKSVALQPGNVAMRETMGRYYLLRAISDIGDESDGERAAASYRSAIEKMPGKAEWWARLAYTKAILRQFDKEFYLSYERALLYGGREYYVNEILMNIGMAYWYLMNVDSRLIFKQTVINTYSFNSYPVLRLAQEYGQLRMICIWVRSEGASHKLCEKELSK